MTLCLSFFANFGLQAAWVHTLVVVPKLHDVMTAMSGAHCEEEASMACFGLWLVIIVLLQFCYACKQSVQYVPRRQDAGRSIKEAC